MTYEPVLWPVVKSRKRMKLETNHLFNVMESHKHNILLVLVRFAAAVKNIKVLDTSDPQAIEVCVNIPAAAVIPVVVCCRCYGR
jgi:hypothetical protein